LMPVNFTTLPHFSLSSAISLPAGKSAEHGATQATQHGGLPHKGCSDLHASRRRQNPRMT
jgi:hypothetical protein